MKVRNSGLIVAAVVLIIVSLMVGSHREGAEFAGADDQAKNVIATLNPDYRPWFSPFWEPPSGEVASLLFALQAALGSGLLGYYLGLRRGQSRQRQPDRVDAGD
jgi:cobalt/nickel transport protein